MDLLFHHAICDRERTFQKQKVVRTQAAGIYQFFDQKKGQKNRKKSLKEERF
jgi:hypothetical protein